MRARPIDPAASEAGFITPVFAGVVLTLSLIAAAILVLARQDLITSNRDARRIARALWLEGVATQAALKVRTAAGQPVQRWKQDSAYGVLEVIAEPEDRKAAPQYADRPENLALIGRLVASREITGVGNALVRAVSDAAGQVHRSDITGLSADRRWRDCATTIFSPHSRLTSLAPDPAVPAPAKPTPHQGELWRISVISDDGAYVDQIVRFGNEPRRLVEVVEQRAGQERRGYRRQCRTLLQSAGSAS